MWPESNQSTSSPPVVHSGRTVDSPLVHPPYRVDGGRFVHAGDRQPSFELTLRALPGSYLTPLEKRLARVLKYALRTAGLRCTRCTPAPEPKGNTKP